MKISINWLKDYIDIDQTPMQIADILSDLGFPTEGIETIGDDTIVDVEITSNRGDCLGYIGVARELAAVTGNKLKIPQVELPESDKQASEFTNIEIAEPDLCHRYTGRIIQGVKVAPSPDWLVNRLQALGMRSVNNIVDATNYVMIETGQPPHAFDFDKITDGKIIVRKAKPGEQIVSIDGSKCDLDPDMLIIADAKKPVAIAGIMGGLDTEVSDKTTTVLLEDAHFDPVSVRTTSRKLTLASESSFRFERIVDTENIDAASKRTAQLIIQLAGGKVAKGVVDIYPKKPAQKHVTLRIARLNKLLGIDIPPQTAVDILASLQLNPKLESDIVTCEIPSWRSDIYREVDLIEEVARVHGYDKIPTQKRIEIEVAPVNPHQKLSQALSEILKGCGFYETINVTFIDNATAELFAPDTAQSISVKDESRKNASLLRQNLIGSLLGVLKTNLNAKNSPCRIFELADTFISHSEKLPIEKTKLSLVCDSDLRDLRGVIEAIVKSLDKDAEITFTPHDLPWAQIGAQILVNGDIIGTAGIVNNAVKEKFDFKELTPVAAELDFAQLQKLQTAEIKMKPISRFPSIERDLSLILDEQTTWADITQAVNKKAPDKLQDIRFVGIYRGKGVPDNKKSLTLTLTFRDEDGTLTHETVDKFQAGIVKELTKKIKAELRTA
ncbi:MAG: phenylalanine--tRNA ligase subunit beta [Planctomycetes bacterium]|nr:phenylalanine--tRNA ligase subunit beta [Planctomycetota bacterium]